MDLHVFPIPIPPPTSLSTRFLWVFPVNQFFFKIFLLQGFISHQQGMTERELLYIKLEIFKI